MTRSPMTGAEGQLLFQETVLGRHRASYYLDRSCGYIWVESPHWLDEAYSSAIAATDTGILARNTRNVERIALTMRASGMDRARGIDLGGGYGLFVRGMRDAGFDFYWSDAYADNLVAMGFDSDDGTFAVGAAFEVLEHLENPLEFLRQARSKHGLSTIFFSATCFKPEAIPGRDWWYWAFVSGQHISFFSRQCLQFMASELGLRLVHLKSDIYAFTDNPGLRWPNPVSRAWLKRKHRKTTLTQSDFDLQTERLKARQSKE